MPEPRDLLKAYRDVVQDLRRKTGPAGALLAPLELTADVLDQLFVRQQDLEAQVAGALAPLGVLAELTRDGPASLRTQAKAFEAASVSFAQAAAVMSRQADLLERALGVLEVPKGIARSVRPPADVPPPPADA